jgi:hypothetical protein
LVGVGNDIRTSFITVFGQMRDKRQGKMQIPPVLPAE